MEIVHKQQDLEALKCEVLLSYVTYISIAQVYFYSLSQLVI